MTVDEESVELEALLWAWTNLMGRLPDSNTMTETEIAMYWVEYAQIVERAVVKLTGQRPDAYLQQRAGIEPSLLGGQGTPAVGKRGIIE